MRIYIWRLGGGAEKAVVADSLQSAMAKMQRVVAQSPSDHPWNTILNGKPQLNVSAENITILAVDGFKLQTIPSK